MFSFLLLCLFATTVSCSEYGWKEKTRYQFRIKLCYNDYTHESVVTRRSIVMLEANLYIVPLSSCKLSGAIRHVEGRRFVTTGGLDRCASVRGLLVPKGHFSGKPFEIDYKKGLLTGIATDKFVPEAELDLIKSIAFQLQLDLQGENCAPGTCRLPTETQPSAIYNLTEKSNLGACETQYEVSALPDGFSTESGFAPLSSLRGSGKFFEVVKITDYDRCSPIAFNRTDDMVEEYWGLRPLTVKSTNRVVILGSLKQYIVRSSVSTSVALNDPDIPRPLVFSILNVTLISTEPFDEPPPNVTYPVAVDLTKVESFSIQVEDKFPLHMFY